MSDVYSYPLLVELEENNFPKIEIRLLKYFNSKKSGGRDCEVDYERDSRTAVLRFRTEQDQKNVLGKESHQIQLDTAVLKMTVRFPPDEKTAPAAAPAPAPQKQEVPSDNVNETSEVQAEAKGRDDVAAEETLCSTSAVLGNVPEETSLELLEMLVENIIKGSKSPSASFTLEIIHGISSVVVTFESGKESTNFVARCPQNRMFTSKGLSVRPLEVTKQVAIEDTQKFEKDYLHLYFENAGEGVESVLLIEGEQFIVTFKDSQAVQKVVKKKHHIQQEEFRVYPFYSSLGAALYGKDRPCLNLPAAISEPTDDAVWRYLNEHKSALETIHRDLAKHFCSVKHKGSAVILRPVPSILGQKDAKAIIKEWKSTVGSAFAQAMSKFKSLKFQPDSEVLEECVENIGQMLHNKDVTLVHDKASGVLSVVGFVDEVNKLEQSLRKIRVKQEVPSDNVNETSEVQAEAKGRDDVAAEETLCSTSAVLGNVPKEMSLFILEMLVENIIKGSKSPSASFTLEIIHGISSVVVTFESGKESTDFVARCPQNKMFTSKGLSVRPLELTKQVAIEDTQKFDTDFLHLYFENAGEDVESVLLNEGEQFVVTFKDSQAVQKVMKKKHHIQQEEFRVYPFYPSLGAALYGKDRPCLNLPAAISEPTDDAVWRYLNEHKSALETIHSDLAKHFCNVKHEGSAVILRPVPSILGQKDAKAIIKEWKSTVGSAFAQAMSKFKSLKFQPDSEVLEECVENIGQMLQNKDVTLVHDKASGVLSVVGFVDEVNKLEQSLHKTINKIEGRVQREKATKTDVIKVSPSIFQLLRQDGLLDKLQRLYPDLKMSFPEDSPDLIVTGLRDEILEADKVIREAKYSLKRMNLEMEKSVLDWLMLEEQDELTKALLTSDGINAAFEISEQRVELLALCDRDLSKAEDHLKKLLMSQNISVEDSSVLETPAWQDLVRQLQDANSKSCRRLQVLCTGKQVVVSGHKSDVMNVNDDLEYFLTQNAKVEESVDVKPNTIIEYIKKCKTSSLDQVKDKVKVSFRNEAICLNGSRVDVTHCKTLVENLVQSLSFESVNVTKPGVKKFFQDKETMYVTSLLTDTGCLVQLVDKKGGGQNDLAQSSGPKPVYQFQTSDGVEIAVCKADLCSYPVDAVVNSSNQQLEHSGGLGAALLNAAGPHLQVKCDKIINLRGPLKPGDCVITDAGGRLCCKKIIHAFGPVFDPSAPSKSQAQLKRAVKGSLDLAERHGCITVALPTISRTQGFGLDLCALTIIKALKEHCDEKYNDTTLKEIHLVNNDDAAVQAMERAVKSEFGNSVVTLQAASPLLTQARSTQSDPNCLGQVTTIEGLNITLTQGNIEAATTEVIVNTTSEDLELKKGAVSNAILHAAGPELQQSINAQEARGSFGEVIVTDGCRLKSKKVFHAIAPHWDKGQGGTERILGAIFKDCLDEAEDTGLTSIALPAVGTGNLCFPRDLVASSMLSEISAFSMKKPKHLKEVVIVLYPGDAKTIQAFRDGFDKEFPSASGGPAPTGSPQNTVQQDPFSNVNSSTGMHETKIGGVTIQVLSGDITKETSEVIVNSSNDSFSLKSGVSKAILEAAGQAVEGECQRLGALPNQGMIMTSPGNLSCKKILHVIGQNDPGKIKAVVKSALEMCVKNGYASVSLPAIGTGQGNVQARQVADAFFDAVIDVLSKNTHGSLKTIRIVIFQAPMLNEFQSSMQHKAQSAASKPSDKDSGWFTKLKSFLLGGTVESVKPRKEENFVIKPVACDPACFHICGDTQAKVASAKQWINDLITKDQSTNTIKDTAILGFSDADHKQIINIQKTVGVSIMIKGKKDQVELTIEGFDNGVLRATAEIYTMMKKVKDDDGLKKYVAMVSTVADWQYQQQGLQYQSFDPFTNFHLEQAMQKKLTDVKVNVQGQDYTVNLPNGPATNKKGDALQIRRIDKLKDEVPELWDAMPPNTTCVAVPIHMEAPEYNDVLKLFQASCKQTVIKIDRIQNPILWKSIQIKKRDIEQRNGHTNNERRLFHGTTETIVNTINENGFNRVYAGKTAAAFGNGTYFAVRADYSAQDTYSKPNPKGEKCMYLCQVLTGDYALGQQDMIEPPVKHNKAPQLYDSVVDNMANPSMFIIFHDVQAYPEYLITFQ